SMQRMRLFFDREVHGLRSFLSVDGDSRERTWRMFHAGDQPRPALEGEVRPRPRDQHDEPIAKPDQVQDVHEKPGDPGKPASEVNAMDVRDRTRTSDRGHHALVDVTKRL